MIGVDQCTTSRVSACPVIIQYSIEYFSVDSLQPVLLSLSSRHVLFIMTELLNLGKITFNLTSFMY